MHLNSRLLFEKYALTCFRSGMRVLEIGPDGFPSSYQKMVIDAGIAWDTVDLQDDPRLTYRAQSEYRFPIPDNSYDVVVSGQVIEHVRKVWVWIREVSRVTRVGGTVITINPVSWPYHDYPVDCWRIYPDGMVALYDEGSLDVVLSRWESLETPEFRKRMPGRSLHTRRRSSQVAWSLLGRLGFRVECAYDTITIGTKRPQAAPRI
jgi:SAM-dependent methyltransferase